MKRRSPSLVGQHVAGSCSEKPAIFYFEEVAGRPKRLGLLGKISRVHRLHDSIFNPFSAAECSVESSFGIMEH